MADEKTLVINAVVDYIDGPEKKMWVAQVVGGGLPFTGLFAWGDDFAEARDGLAQVVWAGLAQELAQAGSDVASVRVQARTSPPSGCLPRCKTFSVAELAEAT